MAMATGEQPKGEMTAVRMYQHGGPEVLKVERHPIPTPGPNELLVRVQAASVSWWDTAYRTGLIKPIPGRESFPMPQQLGREAAGDVVVVGSSVQQFKVGDKVVMLVNPACGSCFYCLRSLDNLCIRTSLPAHTAFGGYAEYIVRPENGVVKAPDSDGLNYEKLACVLWSYGTVFHMMNGRAELRPGESVLITGASGGMGTAAIQLSKFAGARPIIALSSNTWKSKSLLAAGADVVLNYKDIDIRQQILAHTNSGFGVDVVLDSVGGPMAQLGIDAARMGGRVVLAATMGGSTIELDLRQIFVKNLTLLGARASTRRDQETVLQLAAGGIINPIISHTFLLEEVVEATKLLESGQHVGKIVLVRK
jgi:2-desacetyl-2-hydroxyethyl bacteriochlorophyllide A dehydrogenase